MTQEICELNLLKTPSMEYGAPTMGPVGKISLKVPSMEQLFQRFDHGLAMIRHNLCMAKME